MLNPMLRNQSFRLTSGRSDKRKGKVMKINCCVCVTLVALTLFARDHRVLVLRSGDKDQYAYAIKEDGSWEKERMPFFKLGFADLNPKRCQIVNKVLYVMCVGEDTVEGVATSGYGEVIRFNLDGSRIDEDAMFKFDGKANGMAITPDGKYIFIGISKENYMPDISGRVWRYDTVNKKLAAFADMIVEGKEVRESCYIQEMCCDTNGFLYVTERQVGRVNKYKVDENEGVYVDRTKCVQRSKVNVKNGGAICYSPNEDCLYHGSETSVRKLNISDLSIKTEAEMSASVRFYASAVIKGVPYLVPEIKSVVYAIDASTLEAKVVLNTSAIDICHIPFFGNFTMVVR